MVQPTGILTLFYGSLLSGFNDLVTIYNKSTSLFAAWNVDSYVEDVVSTNEYAPIIGD